MGAYKQFLASDVTVIPFEVNKSFSFSGSQLTGSDVSINRYLGKNISGLFNPLSDPTTGTIYPQYQRLVYDSVKELYYSNYLSSSYGSPATTQSLVPGATPEGDVFTGPSDSGGRYFNYNQTTLTFSKIFPTSSGAEIAVMSIPSKLYGNYIQPGSFVWSDANGSILDDSEGNLIISSSGEICGQIFYPHGILVLTTYPDIEDFILESNVTCSFSSSLTIYETQYKCTIRENEYTLTQNPSALADSEGNMYSFVTAPYFSPYVTTVGLYDDEQNLLAIGKLSQPLPTSPTTDTTIVINIDR
jgi:hypothetical protein